MKVSVILWLIKKLYRYLAYVENGDTATQDYARYEYLLHKGILCVTNQAITSGQSFSTEDDGNLLIPIGGIANNTIPVSYVQVVTSSQSIANSTSTTVASLTVPPGTYLVCMKAKFAANTTGSRGIMLAGTASFSWANADAMLGTCPNFAVPLSSLRYVTVTVSTTYKLLAYLTSGAALNVTRAELMFIPVRTSIPTLLSN